MWFSVTETYQWSGCTSSSFVIDIFFVWKIFYDFNTDFDYLLMLTYFSCAHSHDVYVIFCYWNILKWMDFIFICHLWCWHIFCVENILYVDIFHVQNVLIILDWCLCDFLLLKHINEVDGLHLHLSLLMLTYFLCGKYSTISILLLIIYWCWHIFHVQNVLIILDWCLCDFLLLKHINEVDALHLHLSFTDVDIFFVWKIFLLMFMFLYCILIIYWCYLHIFHVQNVLIILDWCLCDFLLLKHINEVDGLHLHLSFTDVDIFFVWKIFYDFNTAFDYLLMLTYFSCAKCSYHSRLMFMWFSVTETYQWSGWTSSSFVIYWCWHIFCVENILEFQYCFWLFTDVDIFFMCKMFLSFSTDVYVIFCYWNISMKWMDFILICHLFLTDFIFHVKMFLSFSTDVYVIFLLLKHIWSGLSISYTAFDYLLMLTYFSCAKCSYHSRLMFMWFSVTETYQWSGWTSSSFVTYWCWHIFCVENILRFQYCFWLFTDVDIFFMCKMFLSFSTDVYVIFCYWNISMKCTHFILICHLLTCAKCSYHMILCDFLVTENILSVHTSFHWYCFWLFTDVDIFFMCKMFLSFSTDVYVIFCYWNISMKWMDFIFICHLLMLTYFLCGKYFTNFNTAFDYLLMLTYFSCAKCSYHSRLMFMWFSVTETYQWSGWTSSSFVIYWCWHIFCVENILWFQYCFWLFTDVDIFFMCKMFLSFSTDVYVIFCYWNISMKWIHLVWWKYFTFDYLLMLTFFMCKMFLSFSTDVYVIFCETYQWSGCTFFICHFIYWISILIIYWCWHIFHVQNVLIILDWCLCDFLLLKHINEVDGLHLHLSLTDVDIFFVWKIFYDFNTAFDYLLMLTYFSCAKCSYHSRLMFMWFSVTETYQWSGWTSSSFVIYWCWHIFCVENILTISILLLIMMLTYSFSWCCDITFEVDVCGKYFTISILLLIIYWCWHIFHVQNVLIILDWCLCDFLLLKHINEVDGLHLHLSLTDVDIFFVWKIFYDFNTAFDYLLMLTYFSCAKCSYHSRLMFMWFSVTETYQWSGWTSSSFVTYWCWHIFCVENILRFQYCFWLFTDVDIFFMCKMFLSFSTDVYVIFCYWNISMKWMDFIFICHLLMLTYFLCAKCSYHSQLMFMWKHIDEVDFIFICHLYCFSILLFIIYWCWHIFHVQNVLIILDWCLCDFLLLKHINEVDGLHLHLSFTDVDIFFVWKIFYDFNTAFDYLLMLTYFSCAKCSYHSRLMFMWFSVTETYQWSGWTWSSFALHLDLSFTDVDIFFMCKMFLSFSTDVYVIFYWNISMKWMDFIFICHFTNFNIAFDYLLMLTYFSCAKCSYHSRLMFMWFSVTETYQWSGWTSSSFVTYWCWHIFCVENILWFQYCFWLFTDVDIFFMCKMFLSFSTDVYVIFCYWNISMKWMHFIFDVCGKYSMKCITAFDFYWCWHFFMCKMFLSFSTDVYVIFCYWNIFEVISSWFVIDCGKYFRISILLLIIYWCWHIFHVQNVLIILDWCLCDFLLLKHINEVDGLHLDLSFTDVDIFFVWKIFYEFQYCFWLFTDVDIFFMCKMFLSFSTDVYVIFCYWNISMKWMDFIFICHLLMLTYFLCGKYSRISILLLIIYWCWHIFHVQNVLIILDWCLCDFLLLKHINEVDGLHLHLSFTDVDIFFVCKIFLRFHILYNIFFWCLCDFLVKWKYVIDIFFVWKIFYEFQYCFWLFTDVDIFFMCKMFLSFSTDVYVIFCYWNISMKWMDFIFICHLLMLTYFLCGKYSMNFNTAFDYLLMLTYFSCAKCSYHSRLMFMWFSVTETYQWSGCTSSSFVIYWCWLFFHENVHILDWCLCDFLVWKIFSLTHLWKIFYFNTAFDYLLMLTYFSCAKCSYHSRLMFMWFSVTETYQWSGWTSSSFVTYWCWHIFCVENILRISILLLIIYWCWHIFHVQNVLIILDWCLCDFLLLKHINEVDALHLHLSFTDVDIFFVWKIFYEFQYCFWLFTDVDIFFMCKMFLSFSTDVYVIFCYWNISMKCTHFILICHLLMLTDFFFMWKCSYHSQLMFMWFSCTETYMKWMHFIFICHWYCFWLFTDVDIFFMCKMFLSFSTDVYVIFCYWNISMKCMDFILICHLLMLTYFLCGKYSYDFNTAFDYLLMLTYFSCAKCSYHSRLMFMWFSVTETYQWSGRTSSSFVIYWCWHIFCAKCSYHSQLMCDFLVKIFYDFNTAFDYLLMLTYFSCAKCSYHSRLMFMWFSVTETYQWSGWTSSSFVTYWCWHIFCVENILRFQYCFWLFTDVDIFFMCKMFLSFSTDVYVIFCYWNISMKWMHFIFICHLLMFWLMCKMFLSFSTDVYVIFLLLKHIDEVDALHPHLSLTYTRISILIIYWCWHIFHVQNVLIILDWCLCDFLLLKHINEVDGLHLHLSFTDVDIFFVWKIFYDFNTAFDYLLMLTYFSCAKCSYHSQLMFMWFSVTETYQWSGWTSSSFVIYWCWHIFCVENILRISILLLIIYWC